jgi:hypothetical protein
MESVDRDGDEEKEVVVAVRVEDGVVQSMQTALSRTAREHEAGRPHHSALSQFAMRCREPGIGGDAMICTHHSVMDARRGRPE